MLTIGLIGGVASGKSEVSRLLGRHGAVILDADHVGHEVLTEAGVIDQLVRRWGPGILDSTDQINRRSVAKIVFAQGNEAERDFLNSVSHPRIAARLNEQLLQLRALATPAVVLDAALLIEAGWDQFCNEIVFVDVPRAQRLERARVRGWDDAELVRREATQLPLAEKRQRATIVIDNSGTREELDRQVNAIWNRWFPVKS